MAKEIDPSELHRFVVHADSLVTPKMAASLYARAENLARLPLATQRWIVARARGAGYMGFVVDPYALFLAYEITDEAVASALLPRGYRLLPSAMFAGDRPRLTAILGAFRVRASAFWGGRVELYLIAEQVATGKLAWIICDYESDTINYDPGQGFSPATTSRSVITTTHRGEVLVDVRSKVRPHVLEATASTQFATTRALDRRLWVDGNLTIDYGGRLRHTGSEPFGLIFDPAEMRRALEIPPYGTTVRQNTFAPFCASEPHDVACFPFAQHFLTTSYPRSTAIDSEDALVAAVLDHARRGAV